jgi:hypothetical protein
MKQRLKVEGLEVDILFDVLSGKIPTIESTIPGPFTEFDVDRKISLKAFEGPGEAFKGIEIGRIFVGFSSRRTFAHPDPVKRPKINCSQGCRPSLVPVTVGSGTGFEVIAPTKGEFVDSDCKCGEGPARLAFRRLAPQKTLVLRREALTRASSRSANKVMG